MPNSNQGKRSFFKRVGQAVRGAVDSIKEVFTPKPIEVKPTTKNKSLGKRFVDFITGGAVKTPETTAPKMKTRKPDKRIDKITNKNGVKIDSNKVKQIEKYVEKHNEEIKAYRNKIIERSYEAFDEIVARNMEADIERAVERENRRFTNSLFEDLRDLDKDEVLGRITDETNVDDFLLALDDKMSIEERAEMYKENYVKALYNEYGENDKTRTIATLIQELDTDIFMMSYYNTYNETHLNDIYSSEKQYEYLNHLEDYFVKLKVKENDLLNI